MAIGNNPMYGSEKYDDLVKDIVNQDSDIKNLNVPAATQSDPAALTSATGNVITFTTGGPTIDGDATIADGATPSDSELSDAIGELGDQCSKLNADVKEIRDALTGLIDKLKTANLMS